MILERCTEYMSAIKYDFLDYVCNRLSFLKSALNIDGQKQLFAFKGIVYKTACEMTCK